MELKWSLYSHWLLFNEHLILQRLALAFCLSLHWSIVVSHWQKMWYFFIRNILTLHHQTSQYSALLHCSRSQSSSLPAGFPTDTVSVCSFKCYNSLLLSGLHPLRILSNQQPLLQNIQPHAHLTTCYVQLNRQMNRWLYWYNLMSSWAENRNSQTPWLGILRGLSVRQLNALVVRSWKATSSFLYRPNHLTSILKKRNSFSPSSWDAILMGALRRFIPLLIRHFSVTINIPIQLTCSVRKQKQDRVKTQDIAGPPAVRPWL